MQLPITLVKDEGKGRDEVTVYHAPDLKGWLALGYKIPEEEKPQEETKEEEKPKRSYKKKS